MDPTELDVKEYGDAAILTGNALGHELGRNTAVEVPKGLHPSRRAVVPRKPTRRRSHRRAVIVPVTRDCSYRRPRTPEKASA